MVIFGPNPWVNPFGKMSIFRLFELLVFIAYKGAFSSQIIVKVIFLTNIALKKRLEKWPYLDQNHGLTNPFAKKSIFRLLELLVFIAQKGAFSFQIIVKVIFLTNIALKKRLEKWPYLHQNHGLTPLKNVNFSTFGTSCFYCLERRFFNLEYRKTHFPKLQCLKKTVVKMAIFGPKPWVNPSGKMSIFRLFELQVFIAQKRVFSFYNIVKVIFQAYIE